MVLLLNVGGTGGGSVRPADDGALQPRVPQILASNERWCLYAGGPLISLGCCVYLGRARDR